MIEAIRSETEDAKHLLFLRSIRFFPLTMRFTWLFHESPGG